MRRPNESRGSPEGQKGITRRELLASAVGSIVAAVGRRVEALPLGVESADYLAEGNSRVAHVEGANANHVHAKISNLLEVNLGEELKKDGDFVVTGLTATHGHKKDGMFYMEYRVTLRRANTGEKPHKFITVRGSVSATKDAANDNTAQNVAQAVTNLADPKKFPNTNHIDVKNLEINIHAVSQGNEGEKFYSNAWLILGRTKS